MTPLSSMHYADLIGKPFAAGGRGPAAYDCWGLLQALLRRLGNDPTDFPSDPALLRDALRDEWRSVERREILPGDGVLLRSTDSRWQWHIGVVIDGCRMIHAREHAGVCVERFDLVAYRCRIAGFYRFMGLPE